MRGPAAGWYSAAMHVRGIVQHGAGKGRLLGYPTANIPATAPAPSGIYAARVRIGADAPYRAAAFGDPARGILEAHLLDFDDDLYGLEIEVELLRKLRENRAFESEASLRQAIAEDVSAVREYFDHL